MMKKAILRGLLGLPLGLAMVHVIALFVSMAIGDGGFHPVTGPLVDEFGSEFNAVLFQTILSGILGVSFAAASTIWEVESWGIAKQTGIYFLVISVTLLPIAYFTHWMERSVIGFIIYFGIFIGIFVLVWTIQYLAMRNKISRINDRVKEKS